MIHGNKNQTESVGAALNRPFFYFYAGLLKSFLRINVGVSSASVLLIEFIIESIFVG